MLVHAVLSGLVFGLYFTLIGLGLNLIFGVMRIVNLAHGDFLMLGAYSAFWLFTLFALHPLISAVGIFVVFLAAGIPIYYLVVPRLQLSRDSEMLSLILFFGLSQIIEALAAIAWGASERSAVSALSVLFVYLYLYRTRLGTLTRAVMVSRDEALATGINVDRVSALAFGIGVALAGVAGVFAPFMFGSITPPMGAEINVAAFAVIVVGTLGNPVGTALGGVIYGVSLMLMQTYLGSWANILPNLLLMAVLLVRPQGLLGRRVRHA
jgi:branched-chain amino acid transport system permease protein